MPSKSLNVHKSGHVNVMLKGILGDVGLPWLDRRERAFTMMWLRTRINDYSDRGASNCKGTDQSTLVKDLSVPLMKYQ